MPGSFATACRFCVDVVEVDERPRRSVDLLAVDRERGVAGDDGIDLLVAELLLGVLLDDFVACVRRCVRVDSERGDAERLAHGLPDECPEDGDPLDLVQAENLHDVVAQRFEDDGIDRVARVDALLEVLDPRPGVERRVPELREPALDFGAQLAFERQPLRRAESSRRGGSASCGCGAAPRSVAGGRRRADRARCRRACAYPPSRSTIRSDADCCPRRSPPARCAAVRHASRRTARLWPAVASNVVARASTVSGPTRMFPCAA